jgi:hypothetical protein
LTGLYNHRYMEESFEREAGANASCGRSVGLILDLDRFTIVSADSQLGSAGWNSRTSPLQEDHEPFGIYFQAAVVSDIALLPELSHKLVYSRAGGSDDLRESGLAERADGESGG